MGKYVFIFLLLSLEPVFGFIFPYKFTVPVITVLFLSCCMLYIGMANICGSGRPSRSSHVNFPKLSSLLFFSIATYGVSLGVINSNLYSFLLGDTYHWVVEIWFIALIAVFFLPRRDFHWLINPIAISNIIICLIVIVVTVIASFFNVEVKGNYIDALGVWRPDLGKGFPIVIFIFLMSTFFMNGIMSRKEELIRNISLLLIVIVIALTFKRTIWVLSLFSLILFFLNIRVLKVISIISPLIAFVSVIYLIEYMDVLIEFIGVFQFLTYNPDYTIVHTISDRLLQLSPLVQEIKNNVLGLGFGATFETYDPEKASVEQVHYIHSQYIQSALQLGLPVISLMYLSYIFLICRLPTNINLVWIVKFALIGWIVASISGLILLSLNTLYTGGLLGVTLILYQYRKLKFPVYIEY